MLIESDLFSDALCPKANQEKKKKSRRSSSGSSKDDVKKDGDESSAKRRKSRSPMKETSPVAEAKPLKFYRDTLEEPEDESKSKFFVKFLKFEEINFL